MKKEKIVVIKDIIDIFGYGACTGQIITLGKLLFDIKKYGRVAIEPNPYILNSEIVLATGSVVFLVYKLINNIRKRHN